MARAQPEGGTMDRELAEPALPVSEQAAAWFPDHPAILFEGRAVSYRELNERANRVASALRAAGIRPGEDVFLSGADGTTGGAEMIKRGQLLATSANVPVARNVRRSIPGAMPFASGAAPARTGMCRSSFPKGPSFERVLSGGDWPAQTR